MKAFYKYQYWSQWPHKPTNAITLFADDCFIVLQFLIKFLLYVRFWCRREQHWSRVSDPFNDSLVDFWYPLFSIVVGHFNWWYRNCYSLSLFSVLLGGDGRSECLFVCLFFLLSIPFFPSFSLFYSLFHPWSIFFCLRHSFSIALPFSEMALSCSRTLAFTLTPSLLLSFAHTIHLFRHPPPPIFNIPKKNLRRKSLVARKNECLVHHTTMCSHELSKSSLGIMWQHHNQNGNQKLCDGC